MGLWQKLTFGIENAPEYLSFMINSMEIWMRSFLMNKNLSFYYFLKRKIGKKQAFAVATTVEKALLLFGREKMPR